MLGERREVLERLWSNVEERVAHEGERSEVPCSLENICMIMKHGI